MSEEEIIESKPKKIRPESEEAGEPAGEEAEPSLSVEGIEQEWKMFVQAEIQRLSGTTTVAKRDTVFEPEEPEAEEVFASEPGEPEAEEIVAEAPEEPTMEEVAADVPEHVLREVLPAAAAESGGALERSLQEELASFNEASSRSPSHTKVFADRAAH
ncbi:hypothetical protein MO973_10965 [Paenibacillus sp. TRM 82003]|nr:hypothetical protein [Paenibacillus sp. TRM 82003]